MILTDTVSEEMSNGLSSRPFHMIEENEQPRSRMGWGSYGSLSSEEYEWERQVWRAMISLMRMPFSCTGSSHESQ